MFAVGVDFEVISGLSFRNAPFPLREIKTAMFLFINSIHILGGGVCE